MNQRRDTYRAALRRDQAAPKPHALKTTTLSSRYVRITIEVDPAVRRTVERWARPPIDLLAYTGSAALRVLTAMAPKQPPPGGGARR